MATISTARKLIVDAIRACSVNAAFPFLISFLRNPASIPRSQVYGEHLLKFSDRMSRIILSDVDACYTNLVYQIVRFGNRRILAQCTKAFAPGIGKAFRCRLSNALRYTKISVALAKSTACPDCSDANPTSQASIEDRLQLPAREHRTGAVQLFLYNAAIWNACRIDYHLPCAQQEEGHRALLVDGPLQGDLADAARLQFLSWPLLHYAVVGAGLSQWLAPETKGKISTISTSRRWRACIYLSIKTHGEDRSAPQLDDRYWTVSSDC
ncbi:hypothetical protein [Caballeronia sp. LZ034LL]|uniref:hypothetical protein n=1 Tax=Caballeronia sp. LZ034LL TaxID=3038567 RepID=UPI00285C7F5D|nr:hypothetical protein [Caballeronia sp. LZ034LL]MDR5835667.1 hypothetical protein [Caballeronia sp. LZ034LL]